MQHAHTYPKVTQAPESVGLCSLRLQRVTGLLHRYVEQGQVAGFVTLIARRGAIVYCDAYGLADIEAGLPMRPDTIFRIYSMTKPITAAALMTLYEEGFFGLDDPVHAYIPSFRDLKVFMSETEDGPQLIALERPMTIRHLFTHTSGLVYPAARLGIENAHPVERIFDKRLNARMGKDADWLFDADLAAFVEEPAQLPLAHQPGTEWRYGVSIDVLGRLIEILSGKTLGAFLQERLFEPLGMADTAFMAPADKLARFSVTYGTDEEGRLFALDRRDGGFSRPRAFEMGGGGLVATISDYLRFAQMMLNGGVLDGTRILGGKTVAFMRQDHMPPAARRFSVEADGMWHGYGYGLGFAVAMEPALTGLPHSAGTWHWSGAAGTYFWVDPQEELIGLLMPQYMGPNLPYQSQFRTLVYQALVD
jgi:CubicO group peptidase (beta-lactamase class C family)